MQFWPSSLCHLCRFLNKKHPETRESFVRLFYQGIRSCPAKALNAALLFLAGPVPIPGTDTISDVKDIWQSNSFPAALFWRWIFILMALTVLMVGIFRYRRKKINHRLNRDSSLKLQTLNRLHSLSTTPKVSFSAGAFYEELYQELLRFLVARLNLPPNPDLSGKDTFVLLAVQMDDKALKELESLFYNIRLVKFASFSPGFNQALEDLSKAKAIVEVLGDGDSLNSKST